MLGQIREILSGLHFRFLMLVFGVAMAMLAAQLATDTAGEMRRTTAEQITDALEATDIIAKTLQNRLPDLSPWPAEAMLAVVINRPDVLRVIVSDGATNFLLDGDTKTPPHAIKHRSALEVLATETQEPKFKVLDDRIEVSHPILRDGQPVGAVSIEFQKPGFGETLLPIIYRKAGASAPILLSGLLFAIGLTSQITSPLNQLQAAARAFSEGDVNQDFHVEGAREIRQVGDAFAAMVTKLRASIDRIARIAYVDRTTQLPNREYFHQELERALDNAKRKGTKGAVLFVDLDGFKRVNDTLGHEVGDKLLSAFSRRVSTIVRSGDTVSRQLRESKEGQVDPDDQTFARLGGDEFTIVLSEVKDEIDAGLVAQRILDATIQPFDIAGNQVRIGASIGIASFPRDGADAKSILHSADLAMYEAKDAGKNTYRFYSAELNQRARRKLELETALKHAVEKDEIELYYQPRIACRSGEAVAVEALLRWHHPTFGAVSPSDFIAIAEKTGMMLPLGKRVLVRACRQIKAMADAGFDLSVSVNVSVHQFEKPEFARDLLATVKETGIDPRRLQLEISQRMVSADPRRSLEHIRRLKRAGIRLTIENFGSGYSNLSQLSRLPVDYCEIDVSFLETLGDEFGDDGERGRLVARSILSLARNLRRSAVAKGVEQEEQYRFLVDAGCELAQGYLFARPMPADELMEWLQNQVPERWARVPSNGGSDPPNIRAVA